MSASGGLVNNMSIDDKKQALNQGGVRPMKAAPLPPPTPTKPDNSIFQGKSILPMNEAMRRLKQASPYIPNAGGAMYSRDQIRKMAGEVQKDLRRYGGVSYLDPKKNLPKYFKDLKRKEATSPTGAGKIEARRKMDFLRKNLLGK